MQMKGRRSLAAPAMALLLGAAILAFSVHQAAALYDFGPVKPYAVAGQVTPNKGEGFPLWYRDDSGLMCEPCLIADPSGTSDFGCLSTVVSDADAVDEFFYFWSGATMEVGDAPSGGIRVLYEVGIEGAYLNGPPTVGDEMVFQRTRVRINCPDTAPDPGKPYFFRVRTPYGEEMDLVAERRASGAACIYETRDIGATAGGFGEPLAGHVSAFMINGGSAKFAAQRTNQYGSLPDGGTAVLGAGGQADQVLEVWFPDGTGTKEGDAEIPTKYTNPFARLSASAAVITGDASVLTKAAAAGAVGKLATKHFGTSCKQFMGSSSHIKEVKLTASPTDKAVAWVDVWAEGPPGKRLTVTVNNYPAKFGSLNVFEMLETTDTKSTMDPVVPGTFINKPASYYARAPLNRDAPADGSDLGWKVNVRLTEGSTLAEEKFNIVPSLVLGANKVSFISGVLTLNIESFDGRMFQCGHFNTRGEFQSIATAADVTATGRKLLRAMTTHIDTTIATKSAPPHIHCCSSNGIDKALCQVFDVETGSSTSSPSTDPGTGGGSSPPPATFTPVHPAVTVSANVLGVTAGSGSILDASLSTPDSSSTCVAAWRFAGRAYTDPVTNILSPACDTTNAVAWAPVDAAAYQTTFSAPAVTTACAVAYTFKITCGDLSNEDSVVVVVTPPATAQQYKFNDAVQFVNPASPSIAGSVAKVVNYSPDDAGEGTQYIGLPLRLAFQVYLDDTNQGVQTPVDFTVDKPSLQVSPNCAKSSDPNLLTKYTIDGKTVWTMTCTPTDPNDLRVEISAHAKVGTVDVSNSWVKSVTVRNDTLRQIGSFTFKIKGLDYDLRWNGLLASEAAGARPSETVRHTCWYTGSTACEPDKNKNCDNLTDGNGIKKIIDNMVCSSTDCGNLARIRSTNPFGSGLGPNRNHNFYCASTAGAKYSFQLLASQG